MSISKKISEIVRTPSEYDFDDGYQKGIAACLRIAEKHESEYGWKPIGTAPDGFNKQLVRCVDMEIEIAVCASVKSNVCWRKENGEMIFPTEWYKFEDNKQ